MQELNISVHRYNLIDLHIPGDWKISTLREISKKIIDIDHKMPKKTASGIPFLSVRYLAKNDLPFLEIRKEDDVIEYISNEDYEYYSKRFDAEYNDILYSRFGTIGIAKLINIHEKLIASYSIVLIKPITDIIAPLFLTYALNSQILRKQAKLMTQGSSNQNFHLSEIRRLRIPLPPFTEQDKIAFILSKVDELIQKTDQVIEQTQTLKKGLMQRLLTKGIGHTKFKKTSLGEIPEEWELISSKDLFRFITSGSRNWAKYYSNKGPILIRIANLDHDTIYPDFSKVQRISLPANAEGIRTCVQSNDILVSITADIGMIGIVPETIPEAYVNQHIALVRPKVGFDVRYVAWYMAWDRGGLLQFQELKRGVTKVGLGLDDIRQLMIPIPSKEEQQKIASILESVSTGISKERECKNKLEKLKKGLMQKLLTGKIRVKV